MSHFKGEIRVNREEERNVALLSLSLLSSRALGQCVTASFLFVFSFFPPDRQNAFVVLSVEFAIAEKKKYCQSSFEIN